MTVILTLENKKEISLVSIYKILFIAKEVFFAEKYLPERDAKNERIYDNYLNLNSLEVLIFIEYTCTLPIDK